MSETHSNYVVCPKSGLSYTITDDYCAAWFTSSIHAAAVKPQKLIKLVKREGSKMPKSYLVAATLLLLSENELIEHAALESKYCRGHIVEELCNRYTHNQLLALFWLTFNSKAAIKRRPLKINLSTAIETPASLYYQIKTVALQHFGAEDLPPKLYKLKVQRKLEEQYKAITIDKPSKFKFNPNCKLDPTSAKKRVKQNTAKIANLLIKEQGLENPITSYQKAALLLDDYLSVREPVRLRLVSLYTELHTQALGHAIIPRDGAMDKSLDIMIRLLKSTVEPIEFDVDF